MDISLVRAFPTLRCFFDWIEKWFPEQRKKVLSELEELGILREYPVGKEAFASHIMVYFYWNKIKAKKSSKVGRKLRLYELEGDFYI